MVITSHHLFQFHCNPPPKKKRIISWLIFMVNVKVNIPYSEFGHLRFSSYSRVSQVQAPQRCQVIKDVQWQTDGQTVFRRMGPVALFQRKRGGLSEPRYHVLHLRYLVSAVSVLVLNPPPKKKNTRKQLKKQNGSKWTDPIPPSPKLTAKWLLKWRVPVPNPRLGPKALFCNCKVSNEVSFLKAMPKEARKTL